MMKHSSLPPNWYFNPLRAPIIINILNTMAYIDANPHILPLNSLIDKMKNSAPSRHKMVLNADNIGAIFIFRLS